MLRVDFSSGSFLFLAPSRPCKMLISLILFRPAMFESAGLGERIKQKISIFPSLVQHALLLYAS